MVDLKLSRKLRFKIAQTINQRGVYKKVKV